MSPPYDADAIDLAVEIVSVSSVENDYVSKPREYAAAGIPVCLVLDPSGGGYRERATGPYGKTLTLHTGEHVLSV
ncbi:Uma2 family endonuclease [Streptomyces sp. BH104]|uniref:Uma2 family endonuclease n=1 Tax=unclassified Streptomyces TaxID=2593676 RepID=UPI003BB53983